MSHEKKNTVGHSGQRQGVAGQIYGSGSRAIPGTGPII